MRARERTHPLASERSSERTQTSMDAGSERNERNERTHTHAGHIAYRRSASRMHARTAR